MGKEDFDLKYLAAKTLPCRYVLQLQFSEENCKCGQKLSLKRKVGLKISFHKDYLHSFLGGSCVVGWDHTYRSKMSIGQE